MSRAHYELELELRGVDEEDEALAIARGLSRQFASPVNVYRVELGQTFADADSRAVVATVEA